MKKIIVKILVAVFIFCVFPSLSFASLRDKEVLRGLSGASVEIMFGGDSNNIGLNETQIRTDVELKLRLAGITVYEQGKTWNDPNKAELAVTITVACMPDVIFCATSTDLSLKQAVSLLSNPVVATGVFTWGSARVGLKNKASIVESIREDIKDLLDMFLNDYLSVNPK